MNSRIGTLGTLFAAAILLASCGGGGGGSALPAGGNPSSTGNGFGYPPTPKPSSTPTVQPSGTPSPGPTSTPIFNPGNLPILQDTSNDTSGVFLGADCGPWAAVSCTAFPTTFRHGIAMATTFSTWDQDLARFISVNQLGALESQGTIPDITWQAMSVNSNITLAGIISGTYDSYITTSAQELKSFGQPIYLRLFHEFNTERYPWGLYQNGADSQADATFIAAWQHVVNIFRAQGASNVKFIWCFNSGTQPTGTTWNQPFNAYPGDAYVDWIAFDGYNMGSSNNGKNWFSWAFMAGGAYKNALRSSQNKPVMIVESGSNEWGDGGAVKAGWIDQMFAQLQASPNPFPHLHAISWYEADTATFLLDSKTTMPVYQTFTNDIRTYQPNGDLNFRSNGNALWTITSP